MRKQAFYLIIFLGLILGHIPLHADNRIILYLKHAPEGAQIAAEQEALAATIEQMETSTPAITSQNIIKNSLRAQLKPALSGIIAVYGGYSDISDADGLISFPLRHVSKKIYLAITTKITMINIKGATFSHREYSFHPQAPVQIFSFQMNKDTKGISFWAVRQEQIPVDRKINPITMVLFTDPKNIVVPLGDFFAPDNAQLVLPPIYLIGRLSTEEALLASLDIRQYFEPISVNQRKLTDTSVEKMISNL